LCHHAKNLSGTRKEQGLDSDSKDNKKDTALVQQKPGLKLKTYTHAAGGMGALTSVFKEATRHSGLIRGSKLLARMNQPDGFDCPGCAWPDPAAKDRSAFEFCENGAKAIIAEGTKRRVDADFFAKWPIDSLLEMSDHWLEAQGRLTQPMYRPAGATHYQPIEWDDAFERLAAHLNGLANPNEAVFYTSGRTSNEAAFLYQAFVRHFGTNNMPDCSNMCHESSGRGLGDSIGVGKGTVSLEDFEKADAIFVIGQNPGTNHPRMLTALEDAKKRGCTIVSINPLKERGLERFSHPQKPLALLGKSTTITDLYLQVRINGDVALLKGIMKVLLEKEASQPGTVLDHVFIKDHTAHFESFCEALKTIEWSEILDQCGIDKAQIEEAAEIYCRADSSIICWAMGLTQHKNGVGNIQEVVNLLLLKGNIGRDGAGACPVRGHSNVQGDRTMGIVEKPSEVFLDRLEKAMVFEAPREHGFDTVEAIHAMADGHAKVFFAMGGNFVAATPDTAYTSRALQNCDLTVQVSTKLNRSHLITGREALIFPCLGRSEQDLQESGPQFVSCENSMSIVTRSQGHLKPASTHLRSETDIVAMMAKHTLGEASSVDWIALRDNYDQIRTLIEQVVAGFENYNERIRTPDGFVLPNTAKERVWNTASQKAEFTVHSLPELRLEPNQYMMGTIRSHDQYNTTIYGLDDRYRGIFGERRVIMMNPKDIRKAGFTEGQLVDITSHFQEEERRVEAFLIVEQDIPTRCVFTYFPEANPLIPVKSVADLSNTPTSKSVIVSIEASTSLPK